MLLTTLLGVRNINKLRLNITSSRFIAAFANSKMEM
jgi:hypothetical protein